MVLILLQSIALYLSPWHLCSEISRTYVEIQIQRYYAKPLQVHSNEYHNQYWVTYPVVHTRALTFKPLKPEFCIHNLDPVPISY